MRGIRQGSVTRAETTVAGYRPRRGGTSMRAMVFLLVLALIVVGAGVFIGIPAFRGFARGLADGNTSALNYPFVGDAVRQDLGDELIKPMGVSDAVIEFSIAPGDTIKQIAVGLTDAELIKEPMVFIYLVVTEDVASKIKTGTFNLRQTMTPQQIVDRLQLAPEPPPRPGRGRAAPGPAHRADRGLPADPGPDHERQGLVRHGGAPAGVADRRLPVPVQAAGGKQPRGLPRSRGGLHRASPDITPDAFTRMLLDQWEKDVGQTVIDQATAKKENFYQVLTLASIVERETVRGQRARQDRRRLHQPAQGPAVATSC